jgi:hypothetical protein
MEIINVAVATKVAVIVLIDWYFQQTLLLLLELSLSNDIPVGLFGIIRL